MNIAKAIACLLLAVTSTFAQGADSITVLRVESSRTMKIAVYNADQSNPANERLYKALAESLGYEISMRYRSPLPLKPVVVDARTAADGLASGQYDLVAVVGSNIPAALTNNDFKRLKAVPANGNKQHVLNLLVSKNDLTLSEMVDEAFPTALNETFFQLAFANFRKSSLDQQKMEWSVAVASMK